MSCHPPLPPPEEVHIWKLEHAGGNRTLLSPGELKRMESYRFPQDRERYGATQTLKRLILSRYLGSRPEELIFQINPQGKPAIEGLEFSLSHTTGLSLLAVATRNPVGVDIERIAPQDDLPALSQRILSSSELESYQVLSPDERLKAFYQLWTAKEAYVKSLGIGFEMEPHEIETDFPSLTSISHGKRERLPLERIDVGGDFIAHLVTRKPLTRTLVFELTDNEAITDS